MKFGTDAKSLIIANVVLQVVLVNVEYMRQNGGFMKSIQSDPKPV
jgi:hypothetical protein